MKTMEIGVYYPWEDDTIEIIENLKEVFKIESGAKSFSLKVDLETGTITSYTFFQ